MSSKYRKKQLKRQRKEKQESQVKFFRDEWQAMIFLADHGVEVEYGLEVYIPHDHLSRAALDAVDYLVDMGYTPMPFSAKPLGPSTTAYLKGDPANDV